MTKKTEIDPETAAEVLFQSDHTCCVCKKPGLGVQIHHIDSNHNNSDPKNLAVLCVDCHNNTLLKGGFTRHLIQEEVTKYRDDWLNTVKLKRSSFTGKPIEPEMLLVPVGEFVMGSDDTIDILSKAFDHERPQTKIYLPDFYLSKTPITNAEYAAFIQAVDYRQPNDWQGGHFESGKGNLPVCFVSWIDAVNYCLWLSNTTGKIYSLPSEAEWEKAARGTENRIFPWGNDWLPDHCNSRENWAGILPVESYQIGAGPYGHLQMAGNIFEWTSTIYKSYPYDPNDGREEVLISDNSIRTMRNGGNNEVFAMRCAFRTGGSPETVSYKLGFRVVRRV